MAYDEGLAQRIRNVLGDQAGLTEKRMFGGIGFLVGGNMACAVNRDSLIVRVGREAYLDALTRPGTGVFDMTGRPMTGWVAVHPEGHDSDADLRSWVRQGVDFALTLPPK
jgi:TfoX/Sxy family transcriptional regulator of competence genes